MKWFFLAFFLVGLNSLYSQIRDSSLFHLNEVVVTATKTKKQLASATVPVQLISKRDIQQTNANRLQEVLGEFTGLQIASSPLGAGIQLLGLDPDYTLIMIDGVPLIGRLNGILDLSRLSVSGIEQVEIVKGPSSALFGSNALAGVINIITKDPIGKTLSFNGKYSSFNTMDFSGSATWKTNNYKGLISGNFYSTGGYDLASSYQGYSIATDYYGKTVSPHQNVSLNMKNQFSISDAIKLRLDGRWFREEETYRFADTLLNLIDGSGYISEYAINPSLEFQVNPKIKTIAKTNINRYKTETQERYKNNEVYSESIYDEYYLLVDIQNNYTINSKHEINVGFGFENESLLTSRLSSDVWHTGSNRFVYGQYVFSPKKSAELVLGARYENHQNYSQQFNPRLSFRLKPLPKLSVRASVGKGFKKPDFKHLFFNYTNNALGYSVFGVNYVREGMDKLLNNNEIAINPDDNLPVIYDAYEEIASGTGLLNAESSIGVNIGFSYSGLKNSLIDIDIFRNDLKNLIDFTPIALKTNGWQVYSYQNINRVFTQGITFNMKYFIKNNIKISGGYEYLVAKDKKVIEDIKNEKVFAKDLATGISYKMTKENYGGLLYRSAHTANIKLFVEDIWEGISGNIRTIYKGRFGFGDLNNNQILDIDQEYVPGYALVNLSAQRDFFDKKLTCQVGINNLFNYTYATSEFTISSLPGRTFFTSLNYKINLK